MDKKKIIGILGIILLLMGVLGYLGYELFLQKKETRQQENKEKKIKASRVLPDKKKYDPAKYVAPLKSNQETESVFSDKAQVKGMVGEWLDGKVMVVVGEKEYEVIVPNQVYLKCIPEIWTDKNGVTVKAKEVFIDFKKASKGVLTGFEEVKLLIPNNSDILIQVKVEGEKIMTAEMIVGYGCEEKRELKIDI